MNVSMIYCLPFIITLSIIVLIQCEKTQYQYYESGKIRVKEIKSHVNSTKYYYDENGKTIVEKVSNKNGSYIKRHFDDSGKIDNEQESDLHGTITERRYSIDGIIEVENVSDEAGLLLWRDYSAKGILISEERYLFDKKHGVCSKFYCQDGSLKNQCTFKNGEPYNGIWSIDCEWMSFYYKYINGKKEKIEFNFKEFPYDISRSYNVTLLNDCCFH
jgi:hypothetical protein